MGKNTSISLGSHLQELTKALEVGEQSGFIEDFDPIQHLEYLHRQYL